jgi:hypothetical protein
MARLPAERQRKTIILWRQDDIFFTREGGGSYLKNLPNAELHPLKSGRLTVDCLPLIVDGKF